LSKSIVQQSHLEILLKGRFSVSSRGPRFHIYDKLLGDAEFRTGSQTAF
jgi:hypothetical protein